jgi:hypothetical protein
MNNCFVFWPDAPLFLRTPSFPFLRYKAEERLYIDTLCALDRLYSETWLMHDRCIFFSLLQEDRAVSSLPERWEILGFDLGVYYTWNGSVIEGQLWVRWWGFFNDWEIGLEGDIYFFSKESSRSLVEVESFNLCFLANI